jgi:hypothetical protein
MRDESGFERADVAILGFSVPELSRLPTGIHWVCFGAGREFAADRAVFAPIVALTIVNRNRYMNTRYCERRNAELIKRNAEDFPELAGWCLVMHRGVADAKSHCGLVAGTRAQFRICLATGEDCSPTRAAEVF